MFRLGQFLLIIAGSIALFLGILGIFLPLLPTTPFLLLAAACYAKGSDRLYQWLIHHKYVGTYIRNYREGKGIPFRAKMTAVIVLWLSMGFTIIYVIPLFMVKVLLACIGLFFTWFILRQKTLIKNDTNCS